MTIKETRDNLLSQWNEKRKTLSVIGRVNAPNQEHLLKLQMDIKALEIAMDYLPEAKKKV